MLRRPLLSLFLLILLTGIPRGTAQETQTLSLSNFAVPESLGKVQERFAGKSGRWVVNIQDVHAHPAAQENIAAILDHLQVVYGVSTVGVEGSWLETSMKNSWGIPNSREKQMLARSLLENGFLAGPDYAALFSQMPLLLVGIEDPKLYEENREVFLEYLHQKKESREKINAFSKELAEQKAAAFNPELSSFDHELFGFREGQKADKFLPNLVRIAGGRKIDFSDLAQVTLLSKILGLESQLNKEKLQQEAARLMADYKNQRLTFEELLRSGKLSGDRTEFYTESMKYLEIMKLQDQIVHQDLFDQIETLIERVKKSLLTNEAEKSLDQKSENFDLAKKLLTLQATPKDLKKYQAASEKVKTLAEEAGLSTGLDLSLRFYELAKTRDEIFFKKLSSDPKLGGNIAVVTGGFHTEGLSAQLRKADISYLVITPDLAGETQNEEMYAKWMRVSLKASAAPSAAPAPSVQEASPAEEQTLAPPKKSMEPEFDQKNFPDGLKELQATHDLSKADAVAEGLGEFSAVPSPSESGISALSPADFVKLPEREQIHAFLKWMDWLQTSKSPILVITTDKDFSLLLQNSVNAETFEAFKLNPDNHMIILGTDFDAGALAARKARILTRPAMSLEEFLSKPFSKRQIQQVEGRAAGIQGEQLTARPILIVPSKIHETPLPGVFPVVEAILRGGLNFSGASAEVQSRFWSSIRDLFAKYQTLEALRKAA